jgi:hypothetical protein
MHDRTGFDLHHGYIVIVCGDDRKTSPYFFEDGRQEQCARRIRITMSARKSNSNIKRRKLGVPAPLRLNNIGRESWSDDKVQRTKPYSSASTMKKNGQKKDTPYLQEFNSSESKERHILLDILGAPSRTSAATLSSHSLG